MNADLLSSLCRSASRGKYMAADLLCGIVLPDQMMGNIQCFWVEDVVDFVVYAF
jgi:hypothetical protein